MSSEEDRCNALPKCVAPVSTPTINLMLAGDPLADLSRVLEKKALTYLSDEKTRRVSETRRVWR